MKRYVKADITKSDMKSISKNLTLYYGVLKSESDKFFKDFDDVVYLETLDEEDHLKDRADFYNKYLPFAKKCLEIKKNIGKDTSGHAIEETLRFKMYDMAKEVLLNFPLEWADDKVKVTAK